MKKKNVAPNIEMIIETDLDIFITLFKASNSGGHWQSGKIVR